MYVPKHFIANEKSKRHLEYYLARATGYKADCVLLPANTFESFFSNAVEKVLYDGIYFLRGSVQNDYGSLQRIAKYFSQIDSIVTDALGTHIYIAALNGVTIDVDIDGLDFLSKDSAKSAIKPYPKLYKNSMYSYFMDRSSKVRQLKTFLSLNKADQMLNAQTVTGKEFVNPNLLDKITHHFSVKANYNIRLIYEKTASKI